MISPFGVRAFKEL